MQVAIKKVGERPKIEEIDNELETYQKIVGGNIEVFNFTDDILCICNEDGKIKGLGINFFLPRDFICGDVIFVGKDGEDFTGLTIKQFKTIDKLIK